MQRHTEATLMDLLQDLLSLHSFVQESKSNFLGTLSIEGHYIVTYHPHACLNNRNVILNIPCRQYFWI